jgi:toxin ParE1/3/4
MSAGYRISSDALEDLERIWLYGYDTWSRTQADRYYQLIIAEIEYASRHFDSARNAEHIRKGYRSAKVKSHVIFFKKGIDEIVEVVRVLHERMDIENRLD